MRRRWRSGLAMLLALALVLLLPACGSADGADPAPGLAAVPDRDYLESVQAKLFDSWMSKVEKGLDDKYPIRGTAFQHSHYGETTADLETDVVIAGDPVSAFVSTRKPVQAAGFNLSHLHLGGDKYDYYLIGNVYDGFINTKWVRVTPPDTEPVKTCLVSGYAVVCDIIGAINETDKQSGMHPVHRVVTNSDGSTTLLAGVTLRSLLKSTLGKTKRLTSTRRVW